MWSHLEAVEGLGGWIWVSAEGELQKLLDWKAGTVWESFTCIASELTAKKQIANVNLSLHYTLQTLHFLETEVRTMFRSAETNRRFATDFKWQVHEVDKIIECTRWGGKISIYWEHSSHSLFKQPRTTHKLLCTPLFSQQIKLRINMNDSCLQFCNCKVPCSDGWLSHCPKLLWNFFLKKKI